MIAAGVKFGGLVELCCMCTVLYRRTHSVSPQPRIALQYFPFLEWKARPMYCSTLTLTVLVFTQLETEHLFGCSKLWFFK